jgi:hypothetical protein
LGFSSPRFFALRDFIDTLFFSIALDRIQQSFPSHLAVHRLRARILHGDADATRLVMQRYSGCNLVYILAPRPAGSRKGFLKVEITNA